MSDLALHPCVTITLWNYDTSGSSECLGSCKLFISEITGVIGGAVKPLKRITISKRKSRWSREYVEMDAVTRVHSGQLRIKQQVKPEIKGSLKVEVRPHASTLPAWGEGPQ